MAKLIKEADDLEKKTGHEDEHMHSAESKDVTEVTEENVNE